MPGGSIRFYAQFAPQSGLGGKVSQPHPISFASQSASPHRARPDRERRQMPARAEFAVLFGPSYLAGITAYLANGGALERAQEMAAHESPRTTKLYDRQAS